MSYGGKTISIWTAEALEHPASCCHDAQIAAIVASLNDSRFSFMPGKDIGWHELKDGAWVKSSAHGNRLWLETCATVHPLLVKKACDLLAQDTNALGEVAAGKRFVKRMRKADKLLSTSFCNKVHKLLKRMLAGN